MVVFKRIIFCVAVLTAFFSFSQDEVTTINFTSGVYPFGKRAEIANLILGENKNSCEDYDTALSLTKEPKKKLNY